MTGRKPLAEVMAELFHLGEPAILLVAEPGFDGPDNPLDDLVNEVHRYCASYGLEVPLIVVGDLAGADDETMLAAGWARAEPPSVRKTAAQAAADRAAEDAYVPMDAYGRPIVPVILSKPCPKCGQMVVGAYPGVWSPTVENAVDAWDVALDDHCADAHSEYEPEVVP